MTKNEALKEAIGVIKEYIAVQEGVHRLLGKGRTASDGYTYFYPPESLMNPESLADNQAMLKAWEDALAAGGEQPSLVRDIVRAGAVFAIFLYAWHIVSHVSSWREP